MSTKITISDVAKQAGCSKSSVSFVLNQKAGVSPKTKARILKAIQELNYKPQFNFSALDQRKKTILFLQVQHTGKILTEQHASFVAHYLNGAQEQAGKLAYQFEIKLLNTLNQQLIEEICRETKELEGIIILGTELEGDADFNTFKEIGVAKVFIDTYHPYLPFNFVNIDNESAVFKAVHHLVENGHRNLGIISSLDPSYNFHLREESFQRACNYFQLENKPQWLYRTHFDYELAQQELEQIFASSRDLPSAIFCVCDVIALALHKSLGKLGFRLPQDLSIIGFDNLDASSMLEPALTSIEVSKQQIGRNAVNLLHDRISVQIQDPSLAYSLKEERILISNKLVIRDSVKHL